MMPSNILAQRFAAMPQPQPVAPPMGDPQPGAPQMAPPYVLNSGAHIAQPGAGIMSPGMPAPGIPNLPSRPQMPFQSMPAQNFLAARPQISSPMQAMRPGMLPQNAMRQRIGMM